MTSQHALPAISVSPDLEGWHIDETAPSGRDAKLSWEVIRDNSIPTYRIDLVPGYAEIMDALQARPSWTPGTQTRGRKSRGPQSDLFPQVHFMKDLSST